MSGEERSVPGAGVDADGWRYLIEHIQDAVVEFELVDGDPVIREVNRSFVEVFGYDRESLLDARLNEFIVPEWLAAEADTLDARTAAGDVNYQRVRRQTADGLREFLYRGIPYRHGDARTDGFAVYTDLSEIARSHRRLQVLNRVLRHNLRNKANVIAGNTTQLRERLDEVDEEVAEMGATIEAAARDLVKLTHEAAEIHRILDAPAVGDATVDCVEVVERAAAACRQDHPAATVTLDLPETMVVRATERLYVAVSSLLENAVVHNPSDAPRVRVRVVPVDGDGWVDVRVEDDGPEIPAAEREVVTGDAEITSMRHGSGLGLWLIQWTAETFGGELSFGRSDLGGNCVQVRLQRAARSGD